MIQLSKEDKVCEVISLRKKMQTRLATNSNEKEQHTIYVENPVFREKPREQNISLEEITKYNHGVIEPGLVWACAETTISA